jgi:MOSC domain-containing protein YiiM
MNQKHVDTGRIIAVSISHRKGERKQNVASVRMILDHGIDTDAHAGNWHRQVSLLGIESIRKIRAKGIEVEPGDFAENITTEGICLHTLPIGTRLRLGEDVLVEVTQIGKTCHHGCAIFQQVGDCVMPKEGIFVRVLEAGVVKPGDRIEILP